MKPLTLEEQLAHQNATTCFICENPLSNYTVYEHDPLTGNFRGSAHFRCNLNYKIPKFIPVLFHNLSGLYLYLFIQQLAKGDIPENKERYISFSTRYDVDEVERERKKKVV